MKNIQITVSELLISFASYEYRFSAGEVVLWFNIRNPYFYQCSLTSLQYQSQTGEWLDANLSSNQIETDINSISLTGKPRQIGIVWDAASDFRIMKAWSDVAVRAQFNDRPNGTGTPTNLVEFSVDVDFTVKAEPQVIRPRDNDPYLLFNFVNPLAIRPCKMHFTLRIDKVSTFDSEDLMEFDTAEDQTNWTVDGGSYPEEGIDGQTEFNIIYDDPSILANFSEGPLYFELITKLDQFYPVITEPAMGQVYQGTQVDIEGTISIVQ